MALALRRGALLRAFENLLEEPRHAEHDGRSHLAHVLADRLDRLGEIDAHAVVQIHVHAEPLEDVREREHREHHVRLGEREVTGAVYEVRDEVRLREHHPFRLAGRPRSVDDRREVVRADGAREFFDQVRLFVSERVPARGQFRDGERAPVYLDPFAVEEDDAL